MLDKNQLGDKETIYDQRHTVVKMKQLELKLIRMLSTQENFEIAENYLRSSRSNIIEAKEERVYAELEYEGEPYKVVIQKNEERNFDTSCACQSDTEHPLCVHKNIVLLQLLHNYGPNYFDSIRNWDKEKNKLLALYGYSLTDDLKGKFEFTYTDGKPFLRVLDTSIKRVSLNPGGELKPKSVEEEYASKVYVAEPELEKTQLKLGIVITANELQYPYVQ
jgi:non-specific serine/threonine protein kinase